MHAPGTSGDHAADERTLDEARRFVRRMYGPRIAGFILGAICIGGGLWEAGAPAWVWALLAVHALATPHLAYLAAARSRDPYRAELRNLMVDSFGGGAWIAAMQFSMAPSAVIIAMQAMDKAAIGGAKLLGRCLLAQVAGAVAVAMLFRIEPQFLPSGVVARFASAPLLFLFPVMVGFTAYRLSRRVRQQNRELAALSSTDGLTRLPNHSAWLQGVEREFARCRREGTPAAVLMFDLDHFKAVNDSHGHPAGDEVLRGVAEVLRETLRAQDLPGRYGGEEFGVLLPGTDTARAEAIAERVRRQLEWASFAGDVKVTASIGCAQLQPGDAHAAAWVSRADRALYAAKAAGRNRVAKAP